MKTKNDAPALTAPACLENATAPTMKPPFEPANSKPNRPCYRVYDDYTAMAGGVLRPGVWYHDTRGDNGEEKNVDEWLCGPLHVDAVTRCDSHETNYGLLLRFRNLDDRWLTWAMPSVLLAGRPEAILTTLLDMGLKISHKHRTHVATYIANQDPERRVIAATKTGWHGPELFITPIGNIGRGEAIYQSESATDGNFSKAGTIEGWKAGIASFLPGNPLLQLGIGTALAGPLLAHLNIHEGGGFHLLADSSNGKTTIVRCASSAWGHGVEFTLKWNATASGLEGIAALRNDCMLALDELGQADGSYVGDVVYSVADGIGKQRAGRSSAARNVRRWRVMLLSSGEITLETKMAEGGKRVRAGQGVRLVTVSANRTFGAWDNLHGHHTGANLSDALRRHSARDYGHAGPAFVQMLIDSSELDNLPCMLESIRKNFPTESGQSARVAERFAIVALALELAVDAGLLPMARDEATNSMVVLFRKWQDSHSKKLSENGQILKSIRDFIDRHGGSRFQSTEAGTGEVRDRAGYWEATACGRIYMFTRSGLEEAAKGFELDRVVRALDSVNAIAKRDKGRAQASKRLPDKSRAKLYCIDPARLEPES